MDETTLLEKALTPDEAKARGYEGWGMHMADRPELCPMIDNPRIYCVTCLGPLARLAAGCDEN